MKKADLVLVTDGGSDAEPAPGLREEARLLGVSVLGLGIGVDRQVLKPWCDHMESIASTDEVSDVTAEQVFTV